MSRPPRGLSAEESALWSKVAATVKPLETRPAPRPETVKPAPPAPIAQPKRLKGRVPAPLPRKPATPVPAPSPKASPGLDSHWERRLARTGTDPDFTLDLHGHTLEQAYRRLDAGLMQAKAMNARLVLVVTGKSRPVDAADRGERRGAIRAKILDWLAAGAHASDIAAIRKAHRRHGGEGALYLVLRRRR
ncbi:Smr/MutS family protein [Aurantiacibacter rhizosphaerae]|uniref:DNA mismatch repair protein MutS n=1 Tax=Aurantiacibacter rhizosphaerae TaxID=2691582 RepID=A0A844XB93_9SPHN|nr:Smr/MutS family protein [Aurantiacibacter rhizosphaerae]MWV27053.1 DNA mismatch repair protein MutS [Aurantiacibacter rhizosphaerae]